MKKMLKIIIINKNINAKNIKNKCRDFLFYCAEYELY
jgi:hypothetical protein